MTESNNNRKITWEEILKAVNELGDSNPNMSKPVESNNNEKEESEET